MKMEIETATAELWLGVNALPVGRTIREIMNDVKRVACRRWPESDLDCSMALRRPGHDPRPEIDVMYGIIEVYAWRRVVENVQDPTKEIAHSQLPPRVRPNRKVGDPWYDVLAHVLLRGANLEARSRDQRNLNTPPKP